MTKRWLSKKLTQSPFIPGDWRWHSGTASLTISWLDGWCVAQAATDTFIETSDRKRTERAARADVEKRLRLLEEGLRAVLPKCATK